MAPITLDYTCTTPLPTIGVGNIDLDPLLVDTNGWSNLRLQSNSPCINAGNNDFVTWSTDLDGNPRILGGTVDMGAYEFVPPNTPPIADASATPTLVVFAGGACCPVHHGTPHPSFGHPLPVGRGEGRGEGTDGRGSRGCESAHSEPDEGERRLMSAATVRRDRHCPICSITNAAVVLDGSRSSDPDGDSLTYLWQSSILNLPSSTIAATGVVAIVSLPAGIHVIDLVVNDGLAQATNRVTVTVLTAEQAVQRSITQVNESDLRHKQPLLASLEAALASIQRGNCNSAVGQLHAFQNKVRAQVQPKDPAWARELTQLAGLVMAALGGDGSPPVAGKIRSLQRSADGCMHLELGGTAGGVYIVEASTNLLHWEAICVVRPDTDGRCEFEDTKAVNFPCRFYRVVEP